MEIVTWLITLITFICGYILGQRSVSEKKLSFKLPKNPFKKTILGAIPRLTQAEIEIKGTKREGTIKAMEDTLEGII